jgi:hypothetical protein
MSSVLKFILIVVRKSRRDKLTLHETMQQKKTLEVKTWWNKQSSLNPDFWFSRI